MKALDFLMRWQARPFAPFRITLKDGRTLDIPQPQQAAISPGLRQVAVFTTDEHPAVFPAEDIAAVSALAGASIGQSEADDMGGAAAAATMGGAAALTSAALLQQQILASQPKLSPGNLSLMSFSTRDGRRLVHFGITAADGKPLLSTAGTRWNLDALETFDNGRTVYLHHADDPLVQHRIIIWPPDKATFESFAEAAPVGEIQQRLTAEHETLSGAAKGVTAAKDYFQLIKPAPAYVSPQPRSGRDGEVEPVDPARFKLEVDANEVGPHQWADAPRIVDTATDTVIFSLYESNWDADVTADGPHFVLSLRHYPEGGRDLTIRIDSLSMTAWIDGQRTSHPIAFVERTLQELEFHENWEAMLARLRAGPGLDKEPTYSFPITLPGSDNIERGEHRDAPVHTLQLWRGPTRAHGAFLQLRLVDDRGICYLDSRGTRFGAAIELWKPTPGKSVPPGRFTLRLFHEAQKERNITARFWLVVDLESRRIACRTLPGCMSLADLHVQLHKCASGSWLAEQLEESFPRGKEIYAALGWNENSPV